MKTLRETILVSLLVLSLIVVPVVVYARDRDDDRDDRHQGLGGSRGQVAALQAEITALQNQLGSFTSTGTSMLNLLKAAQNDISALQARVTKLEGQVATLTSGGGGTIPPNLTALSKYLTIDPNPINGVNGPHVIFSGVNVHIRSGSGFTVDNGATLTGLGNLIVGYNEPGLGGPRTGSHNIIGGLGNSFTSYGGLVVGQLNSIAGPFDTILGGEMNQASGMANSILGGTSTGIGGSDQHIP